MGGHTARQHANMTSQHITFFIEDQCNTLKENNVSKFVNIYIKKKVIRQATSI